jgi:hypothetical protein
MLLPHEFTVDHIGAVDRLTLVLPVDPYDRAMLVTSAPEKPTAIIVDERDAFISFVCENNTSFTKGF